VPILTRSFILSPPGFRSREAGSFIAQLDDQTARLTEDTRDLAPAALVWQPLPGMNTIGMLLAHIAIVEVYWTQVGPLGLERFETESVIGIGLDDDGMPCPEDGGPPAGLQGKDIAYFDDLLARARAYTRRAVTALTDADLEREVVRKRRDGSTNTTNMRWILYHVVEHFAGHYGQINLLAHQYRLAAGRG
jgi:uncharacterized damage-inducible protein DinB